MLTDFYIKQGDTLPLLVIACEDDSGNPISDDITTATVEIHMKADNGDILIAAGTGTVISNTSKTIGYQWVTGDTDTPSPTQAKPHQLEAQITMDSGKILTIPNASNISIHCFPEIA